MPGRGLALLALLLIAIASCVTFLARFAKENVEVSSKVNDLSGRLVLEDDITFKYFDIIEKDLLRDTSNFESRSKLMKDVCDKYRDPFRPENRGLHQSWPALSHFTFFKVAGKAHAMCNSLKAGSNSWNIFMDRVQQQQLQEEHAGGHTAVRDTEAATSLPANSSCWPDCAPRMHLVQVRHPLQRLVSAYRYVFERPTTYADNFVAVKSLKQVEGSRLSWPQFVNMLLNNQLSSDPELQRLGVAHSAKDAEGTEGEGVKDSRQVGPANRTTVNHPEAWVTSHWAPYWFTCGPCHPSTRPSYILHLDRAEQDAELLLKVLGLTGKMPPYPHMLRGEGGHSSELEKMYFSQLSKTQVWQLFLLYRVDHELFGFSPRRYLEWAEK